MPSTSRSPRAFSALNAPVDSWEPTHATPNRAPSSSENATTATGTRGTTPRSRTIVDGGERRHHAQWPVEGAAVGHGVQVRAGDEGAARIAGPARRHPPRPQVAVAVLLDVHAALLRRSR